jgi:hypothetical protein
LTHWRKSLAKRKAEGGALVDIAESLGTFLGHAEAKWRSWHGEREAMVKAVTEVRDRATALLREMSETGVPRAARAAGRAVKAAEETVASARKVGRRAFSAAQKAEASERMRAYWAKKKRAAKKATKGPGSVVGNG